MEIHHSGFAGIYREVQLGPDSSIDFELRLDVTVTGRLTFAGEVPERIHTTALRDGQFCFMHSEWNPATQCWEASVEPGEYEMWVGGLRIRAAPARGSSKSGQV